MHKRGDANLYCFSHENGRGVTREKSGNQVQSQQAELQSVETRYSEVRLWLDNFAQHIQSGEILNADDSVIIKQLVEQITVTDIGIELCFKCGVVITQDYE